MVGGIWGVKLRPKILFDYDFILMWSTAFENCRIRIFGIYDISPESLIVGQHSWCQNVEKSRFPIPILGKSKVYLPQKKKLLEKKKHFLLCLT